MIDGKELVVDGKEVQEIKKLKHGALTDDVCNVYISKLIDTINYIDELSSCIASRDDVTNNSLLKLLKGTIGMGRIDFSMTASHIVDKDTASNEVLKYIYNHCEDVMPGHFATGHKNWIREKKSWEK